MTSANLWVIMETYFALPPDITTLLNSPGPGLHNIQNILTLGVEEHVDFDDLDVWFEPDMVNTCSVCLLGYPAFC